MTPPTRDLVELILLDSAKIQEEEAKHANEKGYSKHSPALPLNTIAEVNNVCNVLKHILMMNGCIIAIASNK